MTERRLFVGETRSEQAKRNGWSWELGVSTAKYLFDALRDIGIEPTEQEFVNLWNDDGELQDLPESRLIIAMGNTVHLKLAEMGVEHIHIIHPAARGIWKRKEIYRAHLKEQLTEAKTE